MNKYSISYEEVKQWVEKLPDDDSIVGKCGDAYHCIVAEAVHAKYPRAKSASYDLSQACLYHHNNKKSLVSFGEDKVRLRHLGFRFDDLGGFQTEITKEEALRLFEEVR